MDVRGNTFEEYAEVSKWCGVVLRSVLCVLTKQNKTLKEEEDDDNCELLVLQLRLSDCLLPSWLSFSCHLC